MPYTIDPNNTGTRKPEGSLTSANYSYDYPEEMNLKPGSDQHEKLVRLVRERAQDSYNIMSKRHQEWRSIDKVLRAYVPEKRTKSEKDDRESEMPSIIMPQSYATLETILTYMTSAFIRNPIFEYDGVGPEDVLGAKLMQHLIHQQNVRYGNGLALHTQFRDAFSYGVGAIAPTWHRKEGYKIERKQQGFADWARGLFIKTGDSTEEVWGTLYEGNKFINIDPYKFLPDPTVSAHEVQDGEFCGFVERTNYNALRSRERDDDDFVFNVRYLKHFKPISKITSEYDRDADRNKESEHVSTLRPVDVIWMYVDLIPNEYGLGRSKYPEKWMFGLAGDEVLIAAQPLGLNHQMFPIAVAAPDYDGYSANPASRLGIVHDMQMLMDFLYSSHIQNVMKSLNDMFVVDPYLVNVEDMKSPKPGKLIRMRRSAWGAGGVDKAVKQLAVADVTRGNVADTQLIAQFMQNMTGATDSVAGIMKDRSTRISASEFQGTKQSSLSRLEKVAKIISMQSMQPLGYMAAAQTQQFMSEETYVKVVGEFEESLRSDFNRPPVNGRASVALEDIAINYDILSRDGTIPGSSDVSTLFELYQATLQNPDAAREIDTFRLFIHIAKEAGVTNIEDFKRKVQVMPDEEVEQELDRGNIVEADAA